MTNVKARCRKILTLTKDGETVNEQDQEFIKDLLKYHKKGEEKMKDLKSFTTGQPNQAAYTRSFYIVKEDGTKEEISVFKCLEWMQNSVNKSI